MNGTLSLTVRDGIVSIKRISQLPRTRGSRKSWTRPEKTGTFRPNYEYVVRCERLGTQLVMTHTLEQAGVQPGDVIEIQGLPDAGLT